MDLFCSSQTPGSSHVPFWNTLSYSELLNLSGECYILELDVFDDQEAPIWEWEREWVTICGLNNAAKH